VKNYRKEMIKKRSKVKSLENRKSFLCQKGGQNQILKILNIFI